MSIHRLQAVQTVPVPLAEAWDFFSDPRNLAVITPPWLGFTLTTPDIPQRMYPGMLISYTVRPIGPIPVRWLTEITHVEPGTYFVDEQRAGPYAFWHHEHHFRATAEGGTEVRDLVHYAAPLGLLGDLVVRFQVRPKLDEIFAYRRRVIARRLGTVPSDGSR